MTNTMYTAQVSSMVTTGERGTRSSGNFTRRKRTRGARAKATPHGILLEPSLWPFWRGPKTGPCGACTPTHGLYNRTPPLVTHGQPLVRLNWNFLSFSLQFMAIVHIFPHGLISVSVENRCAFTHPTQKPNAILKTFVFYGEVYLGLGVTSTGVTSLGSSAPHCETMRGKPPLFPPQAVTRDQ